MKGKFKIGDKVRLKKNIPQTVLDRKHSSGKKGIVYTITEVDEHSSLDICLSGSNWHMTKWLEPIIIKNKVGGELVDE